MHLSLLRRCTFGAPSCACAARSCSSTAARAHTARCAPALANGRFWAAVACTTCCSCSVQCKCQSKRYTLSRCSACCCPVRSATCQHAGCSRATRRSRPTPRLSLSRAAPPFHLPWCRRSGWPQHESGSPPWWNMPCLRCQLWPACGRSWRCTRDAGHTRVYHLHLSSVPHERGVAREECDAFADERHHTQGVCSILRWRSKHRQSIPSVD